MSSRKSSLEGDNVDAALDALINLTEMIQERSYASLAQFFEHLFAAYSENFRVFLKPDAIESNYAGIHLGEDYEENDFIKMANCFYKNQLLHAKYAIQILEDAVELLKKMGNISNCDLTSSTSGNHQSGVVIVGDLHGNFHDLFYLIKKYGIPGKNFRFVFNGDIVDRGGQQSECLLTVLYAFLLFPKRVFINRGNHEDKSLNLNHNFDPNFKTDTSLKFGKYGMAVFNEAQRVFRWLPLATTVRNAAGFKCFITHGGLSKSLDLNYIANSLPRSQFDVLVSSKSLNDPNLRFASEQITDLLWSDPIVRHGNVLSGRAPNEFGCYPNKQRGIGKLFGSDVTENFCRQYGFDCVIRSHEVRPEGISQDHPRCYTIFSCSHYCQGSNQAAVIYLANDTRNLKVEKFLTTRRGSDEVTEERNRLILTLKKFLAQERDTYLRRFKREDNDGTGYIDVNTWAGIITKHLFDKTGFNIETCHIITLRDHLCPCEEEDNVARYEDMFQDESAIRSNPQVLELLENMFMLIDTNQNGTISFDEAQRAVEIINKSLKTQYNTSFISNMDTNADGVVDYEEFKRAFLCAI